MRRNSLLCALLMILCTLPDLWMYGSTLMTAGTLCTPAAFGCTAKTRFIGLGVCCVFFLGFVVLISLPCMRPFHRERWFEGFWFVTLLASVQIAIMIAYTSMESSYCVFEANVLHEGQRSPLSLHFSGQHLKQNGIAVDFSTNCRTCTDSVVFTKACVDCLST